MDDQCKLTIKLVDCVQVVSHVLSLAHGRLRLQIRLSVELLRLDVRDPVGLGGGEEEEVGLVFFLLLGRIPQHH